MYMILQEKKTMAVKYRDRDARELFFKNPVAAAKPRDHNKKKKDKPRPFTDKERRRFAREHYELHHGKPTTTPQSPPAIPSAKSTSKITPTTPIATPATSSTTTTTTTTATISTSTTTSITTPNKNTSSRSLSAAWSPRILGHRQFTEARQLSVTLSLSIENTPPPSPTPDSLNLSTAWSPRIMGYHDHTFQSADDEHLHHLQQQTLPFTPIQLNDMMSYLDYLNELRENEQHHLGNLSFDSFDNELPSLSS